MAIEIHGGNRRRTAPLFESLPTTHGCITAGLSGEFGRLWVDDADAPKVAHLHLDFHFLGGDPSVQAAGEMVSKLSAPIGINAGVEWEALLRASFGERLIPCPRTAFLGIPRDRDRLVVYTQSLPEGYRLLRVTEANVELFAAFDSSLTKNFRDLPHFLRAGFGFAVEHAGEIVAGCSSFTQAEGEVEIEIDTQREHRRRGLALATGSALVLHCMENGLMPCWDAANEGSALLAKKLGFSEPLEYTAWYTKASEPV